MQTLRVNIRNMLEADYCKLAPWAGTDPKRSVIAQPQSRRLTMYGGLAWPNLVRKFKVR